MSYTSTTIASTLERINKDLFIPAIQRPYVWEPEQIIRLFDSLMQRYPISSLLFWQLNAESLPDWEIYEFIPHFKEGDIHNTPAKIEGAQNLTLVLDGQQRLTSLLIGLNGSYTTKLKHKRRHKSSAWVRQVLYIDLARTPELTADDSDASPVSSGYRFAFFDEAERPASSPGELWFEVGFVLAAKDAASRDELIARWVDFAPTLNGEQKQAARETLHRLWEMVWSDDAIAYYNETSQSYDKVLDIFIRANDGGTKLSRSDLLMSVITLRWQRFSAREETEALIDRLTETLDPPRAIEREFVLRCCLYLLDLDFNFQIRNFSPANIRRIEDQWSRIKAVLVFTAQLMRVNGLYATRLSSVNLLMILAYGVYALNRHNSIDALQVTTSDEERMRTFAILMSWQGLMGIQTASTFSSVRLGIKDGLRQGTSFNAIGVADRQIARGRQLGFNDEAFQQFLTTRTDANEAPALISLVYGGDLGNFRRRLVPLIQPQFLLPEVLRAAGVPENYHTAAQSLARSLVLAVALEEWELEKYHLLDFEQWIAMQPPEFFERHHLPADKSLYHLNRLYELSQARRELLRAPLLGLWREQNDAIVNASTSEPASVESLEMA